MINRHLCIIDMQNDFTLPPGYSQLMPQGGSLYVPGAEKDAERVAKMINTNPKGFTDIHATMDSHYRLHLAHAINWVNSKGEHPAPFTIISVDDVENGVWRAAKPIRQRTFEAYIKALAAGGRYALCIWPEHCLIGSVGWAVNPVLHAALLAWEGEVYGWVDYVTKGSNNDTEHYSAVQADVQYDNDPGTKINMPFIQTLETADEVLITGEALTHCVANTFTDVANAFGDPTYIKKLILLEDACSSIPGFENMADEFIRDLSARGMKTARTTDFI